MSCRQLLTSIVWRRDSTVIMRRTRRSRERLMWRCRIALALAGRIVVSALRGMLNRDLYYSGGCCMSRSNCCHFSAIIESFPYFEIKLTPKQFRDLCPSIKAHHSLASSKHSSFHVRLIRTARDPIPTRSPSPTFDSGGPSEHASSDPPGASNYPLRVPAITYPAQGFHICAHHGDQRRHRPR